MKPEVKVNYAIVLRGDLDDVKEVSVGLETLLKKWNVVLVYQETSGNKLWIREGEE